MNNRQILVVDDDPQLHRLLMRVLNWKGYQTVGALSGEEAVDKFREHEPDLVLMDVMMPGMDGFETTKHIRRLSRGRHVPVIFLSARDDTKAKVTGLRSGGDDYITKPVKMGELLARIEARLRLEPPSLGQLIAVFGVKAGVGVTTVAVNLALALRHISHKEVLLIDWQRPLGDVGSLLGLPEEGGLKPLLSSDVEMDGQGFDTLLREIAPGVRVLLGVTDPALGRQMGCKVQEGVLSLALGSADYVVVDEGGFFSWEKPPLARRGEGINVCVLTPDPAVIRWAQRAVEAVDPAIYALWPVLNREGRVGGFSQEQIEARLGLSVCAGVPDGGERVMRAAGEGRPLYLSGAETNFSRGFNELAAHIHDALSFEE